MAQAPIPLFQEHVQLHHRAPPPRQIFLNSANADIKINESESNVIFYFKDAIQVPDGWRALIGVENAQIPLTYYNVPSTYNTVEYTWTPDGQTYSFTVTAGEYEVDTLVTEINTGFTNNGHNVSISYDENTHKITISQGSGYSLNPTNATLFQILGFKAGTTYTGNTTAPNVISLYGVTTTLLIYSNFSTLNLDSRHKSISHYLVSIPVTETFGGLQSYVNFTGFKVPVTDTLINSISLRLENEEGEVVDLNGSSWFVTLSVTFEKAPKNLPLDGHINDLKNFLGKSLDQKWGDGVPPEPPSDRVSGKSSEEHEMRRT